MSPPERPDATSEELFTDPRLTLLMAEQTAALLHVSPKTLERWRGEGFGPRFIRAGRRPLYRLADIKVWLDANTVGSTSERR